MAYPNVTSGAIMDSAAVLNNDPSKTMYTYAKVYPLLNIALRELQREFELNDIPVTDVTSAAISVTAGQTELTFGGSPALPTDLVEPMLLWERQSGIDPYIPMKRVDFLPQQLAGVQTDQFMWYVWQSQKIIVLAANQNNDIKMEYKRFLFTDVSNTGNDNISVINAQSYLEFKTAEFIASFLAENPTRALDLQGKAQNALESGMGISTKTRQAIQVRHRPFRGGWKRGSRI